jgi:hypothetical protein
VGGDNPEEWQGCKGRSLMLTPYGKVAGVASDSGEATVTVGRVGDADACTCTCTCTCTVQVDAIMHALSIDIPHPNPHPRQVDAIDKFDSCHEAVFEVLEAARCTNSRLGQVSS